MKRNLRTGLVTILLSVTFWFICAPVATDSTTGEEPTVLLLSLEEAGRRAAEFSGAPIEAIVELDRDTVFNILRWHTGQGELLFTDSLLNKRGRRFTVVLLWKKYPLVKDTVSGLLYDTVYASMGGGLKKSNKVVVNVTNLPVVIDSAMFNNSYFSGTDTLWKYVFPDTAKVRPRYPLRLSARDLDNAPLQIQVLPSKGLIVRTATTVSDMEYIPPGPDFTESISFIAYDQKGGQAYRRMVISRLSRNVFPVVDSVRIKSVTLKGTGVLKVAFSRVDTLQMEVYPRDSLGTVKKALWYSHNYAILQDSGNSFVARWICSTKECAEETVDTTYAIDTIRVKVIDDRNDTTVRLIALHKGVINLAPVITSLLIDQKPVPLTDSVASVQVTGGMSASIKLLATDPEKDSFLVVWKTAVDSRLSSKTDSTARYTAPFIKGVDTVRVTLSDIKSVTGIYIRFVVTDISPALDSIRINDSLVKNSSVLFSYPVFEKDTVVLIAYATDWDKEDTLRYVWSSGYNERFSLKQSNRAKYILPAGNPKDTIVLTLQDGTVQLVRKIALVQKNRVPIVDSIKRDDKKLPVLTVMDYADRVQVTTMFLYEIFARDPDGDLLTIKWSMHDSLRLLNKTGKTVQFVADTIAAKDTLTVTVSDPSNAMVTKRIIIQTDTNITK